jgi:hypothetical protein
MTELEQPLTEIEKSELLLVCQKALTPSGVMLLRRTLFTLFTLDQRSTALQRIMQVLGPSVPPPDEVDYSIPSNVSGLIAEVESALEILQKAGIEWRTPQSIRRERGSE